MRKYIACERVSSPEGRMRGTDRVHAEARRDDRLMVTVRLSRPRRRGRSLLSANVGHCHRDESGLELVHWSISWGELRVALRHRLHDVDDRRGDQIGIDDRVAEISCPSGAKTTAECLVVPDQVVRCGHRISSVICSQQISRSTAAAVSPLGSVSELVVL
jgi:hypothetical protein